MPRPHVGTVLLGGLLLIALGLWAGPRTALARPGDLDQSFGSGGLVTTDLGGFDEARDVWPDSEEGIVVAGVSDAGTNVFMFAVVRYTGDGRPDPTFGNGGIVTTPIGAGDAAANAVVVRQDRKVVVAGYAGPDGERNLALARYNDDGSLDTSFGSGGTVITSVSQGDDVARDVRIDSEGRLVVAGTSQGSGGLNLILARYSADGVLDREFGRDGVASIPLTQLGIRAVSGEAFYLIVQDEGPVVSIIAGGRFRVVWYEDGQFDVGIDAPLAPGFEQANGIYSLVDPGRLVIAGVSGGHFAVGMYFYEDDETVPNPAFGDNGIAVTDFGTGSGDAALGLRVDGDGRPVAVGRAGTDFAVARYEPLPEPPAPSPSPDPIPAATPQPTPAPTPAPTPMPTAAPSSLVPPNTTYRGSDRNGYISITFTTNADSSRVAGEISTLKDIPCGGNQVVYEGGTATFDFAVAPNGVAFGSTETGTVLTLDMRIEGAVATGTFTYSSVGATVPCNTGRINFEARALGR
jgi:uncharacterized delta-60 repeat protein